MSYLRTLAHALPNGAQKKPHKTGIVLMGERDAEDHLSFAELYEKSNSVALILEERGVRAGDLVLVALPHSCGLVATFWGVLYAGAIPALLPYDLATTRLPARLNWLSQLAADNQAAHLLTTESQAFNLSQALGQTPYQIIGLPEKFEPLSTDDHVPALNRSGSDIAYVQFTSGTTGRPKGVALSHTAIQSCVEAFATNFQITPDDTIVTWLPLYHDFGLFAGLVLPLLLGTPALLTSPYFAVRRPAEYLHAIDRSGGTVSWTTNSGYHLFAEQPKEEELAGLDLSRLRVWTAGAEPLRPESRRLLLDRYASYGLCETALSTGYGMAESVFAITLSRPVEPVAVDQIDATSLQERGKAAPIQDNPSSPLSFVSCGYPMHDLDVEVVDEDDKPLLERHRGEIRVRGDYLFSGYWKRPDLTAQTVRDGWFYTGDLGYFAEGQLFVCGRKKDLIISHGRNILPEDVEAVAEQVDGVVRGRSVAFGLFDKGIGTEQLVLVCGVERRIKGPARLDLEQTLRRQIGATLNVIPADVRLVKKNWIVRTDNGKMPRGANREKYLSEGWRPPRAGEITFIPPAERTTDAIELALTDHLQHVTGYHDIRPDAYLSELGLDSLQTTQLLLQIEAAMEHPLPLDALTLQPTLHNLANLLAHPTRNGASSAPLNGMQIQVDSNTPLYLPQEARKASASARARRRLIEIGPSLRRRPLPYALGTRLLGTLIHRPRLRRTLFAAQIELLRRCLDEIPVQGDPDAVIEENLMTNLWADWRRRALSDPATLQRWVTLKGAERLSQSEGRGAVLLISHSELKKVLRLLPEIQRREVAVVGNVGSGTLAAQGMEQTAAAVARGDRLSRNALRSAQLIHARRVLEGGGLAILAGDDDEGSGGIEVDFHGRHRPFRSGAAELALRSNADLLPLFGCMDRHGHIAFEVLPALHSCAEDHLSRVEDLTRQYATLLEGRYVTDLGAMEWYILRKHLSYAKIGEESA